METNDLRKAAEMALEALCTCGQQQKEAKEALHQALDDKPAVKSYAGGKPNYCTSDVDAVNMTQERVDETVKSEHEPVAWILGRPAYYVPPQKEWVGLTGDEISECWNTGDVVAAVEAKLKEKNGE